MFSMLYTINQELSVRKGVDCWWYIIPQFVFHRMAILYTAFTIYTTKLQMALMRDNTLKSNLVSFTGSSVEKLDILLPLIFHPSFGLSVVLGTRRKAGGWGWSGVRETVKRLLNYTVSEERWMRKLSKREEKRSTRSNRFMARMICFACLYRPKPQASTINEIQLNKTNHSSLPCTESWDWSAEAALCSFYALCFLCSVPKLSGFSFWLGILQCSLW